MIAAIALVGFSDSAIAQTSYGSLSNFDVISAKFDYLVFPTILRYCTFFSTRHFYSPLVAHTPKHSKAHTPRNSQIKGGWEANKSDSASVHKLRRVSAIESQEVLIV